MSSYIANKVKLSEADLGKKTYIEAYTPGRCAFDTLSGRGFNQRSGLHSSASSPQIFLHRLAVSTEIKTPVFFLMGISLISVLPSAALIGHRRGNTTSFLVLLLF